MNARPNLNDEPEPNEETLVNVNFDNLEVGKYYFVEHAGYWHLMKVRALDDDTVHIGHIEAFNVGEGWGIPYIYIDEEYADGIPKAKVEDNTFSFYKPNEEEENHDNENQVPVAPPAPNLQGAVNDVVMENNEIHGGARQTRRMNRKRRSTRRRHSRSQRGRRAATRRRRIIRK